MSTELDEQFIRQAINQAHEGEHTPGGAQVGAVLVKDGMVACAAFNEGDLRHDPTAHAEMVAIRRLCAELQVMSLEGYTLYCTLQPCGMCTMACLWAGVSRVVYGAGRDDVHAVYFESRHLDSADFIRDAFRDDLRIEGGILAGDCAALYARKGDPIAIEQDPAHGHTASPE